MSAVRDAHHGQHELRTTHPQEVTVDTAAPLTITGERTVPGVTDENYWFRRHEAGYAAVRGWVGTVPRVALDAGCGEGYAAAVLRASWPDLCVVGVDYDTVTTAHAARVHAGTRTAYLRGALTALPLGSDTVDVTVSLQVLEHIWTPGAYVRELARVTRPGGAIVLSTPNRLTFSPGLGRRERPSNLYHCREYDAAELAAELGRWLPDAQVALAGLGHGARLQEWEAANGPVVAAQQDRAPQLWTQELRGLVGSVAADDFAFGAADDACLDLFAVATIPST